MHGKPSAGLTEIRARRPARWDDALGTVQARIARQPKRPRFNETCDIDEASMAER
jgi:hypothetical protein